jgi:hypothetical protein
VYCAMRMDVLRVSGPKSEKKPTAHTDSGDDPNNARTIPDNEDGQGIIGECRSFFNRRTCRKCQSVFLVL